MMFLFVEKARDAPSLMQTFMADPELFLFRFAATSTTAFALTRWFLIDLINAFYEVRRRNQEERERNARKTPRKAGKP